MLCRGSESTTVGYLMRLKCCVEQAVMLRIKIVLDSKAAPPHLSNTILRGSRSLLCRASARPTVIYLIRLKYCARMNTSIVLTLASQARGESCLANDVISSSYADCRDAWRAGQKESLAARRVAPLAYEATVHSIHDGASMHTRRAFGPVWSGPRAPAISAPGLR